MIAQCASAFRSVMRRHHNDPMSLEAIKDYFQELYWLKGEDENALEREAYSAACSARDKETLTFPLKPSPRDSVSIETAMVPIIVPIAVRTAKTKRWIAYSRN